jgi:hypothetical protein
MDSKLDGFMYPYSSEMNDGLEAMDLNIFPNPVDEEFHLALRMDRQTDLRIEVVNIVGQTTYREIFELAAGPQTLRFDAEVVHRAMPESGMYLINLYMGKEFLGTRKLIKQ